MKKALKFIAATLAVTAASIAIAIGVHSKQASLRSAAVHSTSSERSGKAGKGSKGGIVAPSTTSVSKAGKSASKAGKGFKADDADGGGDQVQADIVDGSDPADIADEIATGTVADGYLKRSVEPTPSPVRTSIAANGTWSDGSDGGTLPSDLTASRAGAEVVSAESNSLSGIGIALLSLGSVALIATLLVGVAKSRREKAESYAEFDDDKDHEDEQNSTAETIAHVYDEGDDIDSIIRELRESEAAANHTIHVPQCHSNTCQGCAENVDQVVFIKSDFEKPSVKSPSGLGERRKVDGRWVYEVDDTVEF
jgi:hypothetical protein